MGLHDLPNINSKNYGAPVNKNVSSFPQCPTIKTVQQSKKEKKEEGKKLSVQFGDFKSLTCILGFLQPFDPNKRKSHLKKELKRNFPFARVNPET